MWCVTTMPSIRDGGLKAGQVAFTGKRNPMAWRPSPRPTHRQPRGLALFLSLECLSLIVGITRAADSVPIAPASSHPAWLSLASLGVTESYDNNIFLSGVEQRFVPAGLATLKDKGSWVTTVSPRIGLNLAALLEDRQSIPVLSLGYAPDIVVYHNEDSESHQTHRVAAGIGIRHDSLSFNLDDEFAYIHGSRFGPSYPGTLLNAYATATVRERREQLQDRAKVSLRYDRQTWFARAAASLLYYDLRTALRASTPGEGYQNYSDRYDANGGLDLGWKIRPEVGLTIGYRYGHQFQQQFYWDPNSTPSDYQRLLFGIEAKAAKWLKFDLQVGPDFRSYPADTPSHLTPVKNHHPVKFYGEAGLTAEMGPGDTLTFKFRQFQWVSSLGRIPALDSYYDLNYRRRLTDRFSVDLGARLVNSDYTSSNLPSGVRNDWMYTLTASLHCAIAARLSADLGYSADLGRSAQDGIANPDTRGFLRHVISAGLQIKF